jgi:hypothetical protein
MGSDYLSECTIKYASINILLFGWFVKVWDAGAGFFDEKGRISSVP